MSENRRNLPTNELDLQLMLTEPEWGRSGVPEDLQKELSLRNKNLEKLKEDLQKQINEGKIEFDKANKMLEEGQRKRLWGLLAYYTKDMRLANLSVLNGEMLYCQTWLDFAGDCLRSGFIKPFLQALSRVITILELSQSKGGFLRRRHGTFTQEQKTESIEPKKTGLFGDSKKKY